MAGLLVPGDDEWFDALTVRPERLPLAETWVRGVAVDFPSDEGLLEFGWDEVEGSVSVRYQTGGRVVVELTRESASLVSITRRNGDVSVAIEFGVNGLAGRTVVQVRPVFSVDDVLSRG